MHFTQKLIDNVPMHFTQELIPTSSSKSFIEDPLYFSLNSGEYAPAFSNKSHTSDFSINTTGMTFMSNIELFLIDLPKHVEED